MDQESFGGRNHAASKKYVPKIVFLNQCQESDCKRCRKNYVISRGRDFRGLKRKILKGQWNQTTALSTAATSNKVETTYLLAESHDSGGRAEPRNEVEKEEVNASSCGCGNDSAGSAETTASAVGDSIMCGNFFGNAGTWRSEPEGETESGIKVSCGFFGLASGAVLLCTSVVCITFSGILVS